MVVTTYAVWVMSRRLVGDPLLALAQTVQEVAVSQDYSIRVAKQSEDEFGVLVDDVNQLLTQMGERDGHFRGEGDRLEAEVVARTRELRESNERMEAATTQAIEASKAKSQFIANMTHEIRTPMNGVLGMTELLVNTDLTSQQYKFTRTILESAEDLLSIINNILDFSKVEAGKLEKVDRDPFNPKQCVEKVSDLLGSRARLKGLTLSHECAEDVPEAILGDGKRLRQVLTNLIGNAIKFTERGTIVVRTAVVKQLGDTTTVRFEIVDTGIGIPSHLHQHVFEGFSQADTSTSRQFGGTGLGLAISKHLIDLMGGEFGLISRPGVGSNFWFTVGGELYRPTTEAERDLGGLRALVVATAAESSDAIRNHLTLCGGSAVAVPTAEKALAVLRAEKFDVFLVDTQGLDVAALVHEIRSREATKSLPLVLVSPVERSGADLARVGIDGSVAKPVKPQDLFACLARVTGRLDVSVSESDLRALDSDAWGAHRDRQPEADAIVSGIRILLAEDHPVNRQVATAMLETLTCRVDVVADGAQAIEAVQLEDYDLLFLDCQMPNVDGYDATRQIRRLEQQGKLRFKNGENRSGRLPILALTAHTAPADRAASFESGMDDFVSKPFTLQTLRGALVKWVGRRVETAAEFSAPTSPNPEGSDTGDPPISQAGLDQILELDRLNGGGVFVRFARTFLEAVPVTLEELRTAVTRADSEGVAKSAHALKGVCLNLGAEPMAAASRELERLGKAGIAEGTAALVTKLDELFLAVKAELEARLAKGQGRDSVSA